MTIDTGPAGPRSFLERLRRRASGPPDPDRASTATTRAPVFSALRPSEPERAARLAALVEETNAAGGTYHRLDFGDGLVMQGDYDMADALPLYRLPEELRGVRILDVGTASGLLALECATRGGSVTAVDLSEQAMFARLAPLLNAQVRYVATSVYDLDETFGVFDLVLCGSLLLHLPDPLLALQRLRRVCGNTLVISTQCPGESPSTDAPLCHFLGEPGAGGGYWTYWSIGGEALRRMLLAAGFASVSGVDHFTLVGGRGAVAFATPHVIAHAHV